MDVKSVFLNSYIVEKVYIEQPLRIENHTSSNHVYRSHKALYGLKQAPHAWYERGSKLLLDNEFTRENIDKTLFLQRKNDDLLVI